MAEYNPIHKVVVFGGGNEMACLYKMDAEGKISRLKDAPLSFRAGKDANLCADPGSGLMILVGIGKCYSYDLSTDEWAERPAPSGDECKPIMARVETHGVIVGLDFDKGGRIRYFLYKGPAMGPP